VQSKALTRVGAFNGNWPHGWETPASAASALTAKIVESAETEIAMTVIAPTLRARTRDVAPLAKIGRTIGIGGRPHPLDSSPVTTAEDRPDARAPHAGRMTCSGRSPGSRVITLLRLPRLWRTKPSGKLKKDSPPTVAGAAPDLTSRERPTAPDSLLSDQRDRHT